MNKVILRTWQNKALKLCLDSYMDADFIEEDRAFLTQATPGGGKTIHGLSVFESGNSISLFSHIVIVVPSTELVTQWMGDAAALYGIQLKPGMLYHGQPDYAEFHGIIMTYAGMNENHEALRIFSNNTKPLVIADEAHHLSDSAAWGKAFRNSFEVTGYKLMVTGTPWSPSKDPIPFVAYGEDGYVKTDFSYAKKTAIADRVCRVTEFHPMTATNLEFFDHDTGEIAEYPTLEDAITDKYKNAYQKTIKSVKHMKSMFMVADSQLSMIRELNGRTGGGLVVAADIQTAHLFQNEIFMMTGVEYPIVHSRAERAHDKIKEFRASNDKWLISVGMVTEGVDIKRLQVCIFLSRAKTELFLRQVVGRIERIRQEMKGRDIDQTAFFYYTDHPEINAIAEDIEKENKAGEALLFRDDQDEEKKNGGTGNSYTDNGFLQEVTTEHNKLIAEGFDYPVDVVAEAIARQRGDQILFDVPLRMICKVLMAEQSMIFDVASEPEELAPLSERKARIRKVIQKEIRSKIGRFIAGKPAGDQIAKANSSINSIVGISTTNGGTSMEMLERKLQYINDSEVTQWL